MWLFKKYFFSTNINNYQWKKDLEKIIGFSPNNFLVYKLALSHRSYFKKSMGNNERLEFLGDAILNSIIAEYLLYKYPYKGEGFLTEMRSKMANRIFLNDIALKMELNKILRYNKYDITVKNTMIFGNALEALIGAIYLDKGYSKVKIFIKSKIFFPFVILEELEEIDINIKNKLYGWSFKYNKKLEFTIEKEGYERDKKYFIVAARIEGEIIGQGKACTKKEASNIASKLALKHMNI
ncbi:MAG: ribonuclease III family protein [Chitinophagaceae bacterium]